METTLFLCVMVPEDRSAGLTHTSTISITHSLSLLETEKKKGGKPKIPQPYFHQKR